MQSPIQTERHLAASLWAVRPFALVCHDEAMEREFCDGTIVVFDAARTKLYDGEIYLFNWNEKVILRRWRTNPMRLEPATEHSSIVTLFTDVEPLVIARALQSIRELG
jgi:hypothetical protein